MEVVAVVFHRPLLIEDMAIKMKERTKAPYYFIVIDNGSTLKTYNHLKALKSRGYIDEIIRFSNGTSYAAAFMMGTEAAVGDHFILSDGDITPPLVEPCWLTQMNEIAQRHHKRYGAICMATQLSGVTVLGEDSVKSTMLHTIAMKEGKFYSVKKESNTIMEGLGTEGRVAEVHCAPFWLSTVSREASYILRKKDYHLYNGANPDLVYSNLLRMTGRRVGIIRDLHGIHTGLGWNRGYDPAVYKDEFQHYRPNIPCTEDGMPVYDQWTKKHWWESKTCTEKEFTYKDLKYKYDDIEAHRFIVMCINVLWTKQSNLSAEVWNDVREMRDFLGIEIAETSDQHRGIKEEGSE